MFDPQHKFIHDALNGTKQLAFLAWDPGDGDAPDQDGITD